MIHKKDRYKEENEHNLKQLGSLGFSSEPTSDVTMFLEPSTTMTLPHPDDQYVRMYKETKRPLLSYENNFKLSPIIHGEETVYPVETLRVNYGHKSDNPYGGKVDQFEMKYVVNQELSDLIRAIRYEGDLRTEGAEAHAESLSYKIKDLKAEIKDLTDKHAKAVKGELKYKEQAEESDKQLTEASFITRCIRLVKPTHTQKEEE